MIAADREALLRATFEGAPDGIVVLGAQGEPLAFNTRFQALWNFPPELLAAGDTARLREHTAQQLADPQRYLDSLPAVLATREPLVLDEHVLKDGRVLERHVSPLQVPGQPASLVVRWRDVTTRRQVQSRLAAIFELASNAILLADDQGRYIDANPAACTLLGLSRDELLQRHVTDVVVADSTQVQAQWSNFLDHRSVRGRVLLRRADGEQLVAQFAAVANLQPGVHLSVLTDVTEDERSQQRLQELAALLDLAMLGADLAYWDADLLNGRVHSVNDRWHTMLGYAAGEHADDLASWEHLIHPDDLAHRNAAWEAHLAGRAPRYEAEFRMRHKDGHWVWILARGQVVARDGNGRATRMVGTRMDISAQKARHERLTAEAHTDALTGADNRRHFMARAQELLNATRRSGEKLALLMFDLDHFKAVNDRLGHATGDAVLRHFAQCARQVLREHDVFGRLGGEEFAALLPEGGAASGLAVAQRLLQHVRSHPAAASGQRVAYTLSCGVAESAAEESLEALLARADRALYRAKAEGRDRVVAEPYQP